MRDAALKLLLALAPDEPSTHAVVRDLLVDPWHRMRQAAAEAAGTYAVKSAEPILRRMAEEEPFDGAKAAAKAALGKIAPAPAAK